jgi:hypothetical protein
MQSMFRKVILTSALGIGATLAANSALAANQVYVPFNFVVAGKTLPAGSYNVTHDSASDLVTFESRNSSQSFTWLLRPGQPDPSDRKIALRFDNRDNSHFLQSIQFGSKVTPRLDRAKKTLASEVDPLGQ